MDPKNLKSKHDIHALGVGYICDFLDRAGFVILERNTNPDHHFQLFVKACDRSMLIAVRTAIYPDIGTIDMATKELLVYDAKQKKAIPHFAGLAITPLENNDIQFDGVTEGREYKINFPGILVVRD